MATGGTRARDRADVRGRFRIYACLGIGQRTRNPDRVEKSRAQTDNHLGENAESRAQLDFPQFTLPSVESAQSVVTKPREFPRFHALAGTLKNPLASTVRGGRRRLRH